MSTDTRNVYMILSMLPGREAKLAWLAVAVLVEEKCVVSEIDGI